MPGFEAHDFHIDTFLTNFLHGYRPRGMIADQIFPVITVQRQSNVFARIDRGSWFRLPDTNRAPGTAFREVNYTVSSDTYFAKNYGLASAIPFEVLDNADPPWDPAQRQTEFLYDQLMLDFEVRVASTTFGGVGSSSTLTGAAAWSDFANSDPLTNIETGIEAIRQTTGYTPNLAIIGQRAWLKMRRHPDIVRAIYAGAGVGGTATPQQFGELIGVDRVLVPGVIKNTAGEFANTDAQSFTDVWSTHMVLAYATGNPGIMTPTFGLAFRWTGPNIGANGPGNFAIERKRDTDTLREIIRTGYYQDEHIVAPELGFLIQTGIS